MNQSFRPRFKGRSNNNNFRRSNNNNRGRSEQIDPALFVNKAQEEDYVEAYVPTHDFPQFLISDQLKRNIAERGYVTPTPIQDQTIPHLLEGKDVVGIANTGTGKTAAFLIPLINKILYNRSQRVLIVAPTRELAAQIQDELKMFSGNMNMFSALCIGGARINLQIQQVRRNPAFVIGTPGRLKDLINQHQLNIASFQNIVLDEVDRMMDMGFINDIRFLIAKLPAQRQSLFFSATISPQISGIMGAFLRNPVTVSVKSRETARTVDQDIVRVPKDMKKIDVLHDLLSREGFGRVLLFGRTKWGIEKLTKLLIQRGFRAASIHGNKSQGQRQRALDGFKKGDVQVLLATDVASRGLDIEDVSHVINYETPASYDDYVHRIGRTGRANKRGKALTFVE